MTDENKNEVEEIESEESSNELKLTALKAAVGSGFLSGFTSAANQVSLQLLRRRLTEQEVQEYASRAMDGADNWYVPTFLQSPEGEAIADILGIELPEVKEEETAEEATEENKDE